MGILGSSKALLSVSGNPLKKRLKAAEKDVSQAFPTPLKAEKLRKKAQDYARSNSICH
jgi:hypothetical protein